MKAIGYQVSLPIDDPMALQDIILPDPEPGPRDLLVRVKAIGVNPVDTKVRRRQQPAQGEYKVLGWDASGIVEAIGNQVTLFQPGDAVWYAGAIDRPGCNSALHCVDERIVAKKPASLSFVSAAALPLTTITAWELLFDRFRIERQPDGNQTGTCLLVVGASGGVGSIMLQLAKQLTHLNVIATTSTQAGIDWLKSLGADYVIDHSQSLVDQINRLGIDSVDYVASLTHTDEHYSELVACLAPQGKLGIIDDPQHLDIGLLKQKSIALHWEFMFTRSLFATPDMVKQHALLTEAAQLIDQGKIRSTSTLTLSPINADNLKHAHALLESGRTVGKITLEGFAEN